MRLFTEKGTSRSLGTPLFKKHAIREVNQREDNKKKMKRQELWLLLEDTVIEMESVAHLIECSRKISIERLSNWIE